MHYIGGLSSPVRFLAGQIQWIIGQYFHRYAINNYDPRFKCLILCYFVQVTSTKRLGFILLFPDI